MGVVARGVGGGEGVHNTVHSCQVMPSLGCQWQLAIHVNTCTLKNIYTVLGLGYACGSNTSQKQTAMHTVKHAVSPQLSCRLFARLVGVPVCLHWGATFKRFGLGAWFYSNCWLYGKVPFTVWVIGDAHAARCVVYTCIDHRCTRPFTACLCSQSPSHVMSQPHDIPVHAAFQPARVMHA